MIKWFKNKFYEEQDIMEQEIDSVHNDMPIKEEDKRTIVRNRRFRFPILPDEEVEVKTNKREQPITINKGQRIFTNPYAHMEEEVDETIDQHIDQEQPIIDEQTPIQSTIYTDKQEEPKQRKTRRETASIKVGTRQFQPTEVISPIYGYEQRPETLGESPCSNNFQVQQTEIDAILRKNRSTFFPNEQKSPNLTLEEEEIIEFELPSVPSFMKELGLDESEPQSDVQLSTNTSEVEQVEEVEQREEPDAIEPKMVERVQIEKEGCKVEIENNIQVHVHTAKEEGVEKEQVIIQTQSQPNDEKEEEEKRLEVPKIAEVKREKKRHIPFNVMMLRRDREAAKRKQSQEMKNSPEVAKPTSIEEQPQSIVNEETVVIDEANKMNTIDVPVEVMEENKVEAPMEVKEENKVEAPVEVKEENKVEPSVEVVEEPKVDVPVEEKNADVPVEVIREDKAEVIEEKVEENNELNVNNEKQQEVEEIVVEKEEKKVESIHEPLPYEFPSIDYLEVAYHAKDQDNTWLQEQWELLDTTLLNFNVGAKVIHVAQGPSVTRFEVQPEPGVKVNKITNLTDDIKLNLAAKDIRIEAPIPGKNAVGIEVPNKKSNPVFLREILESDVFSKNSSPLTIALGLDISGEPIVTDIRKMPHGLIAGATGSGKSVCINSLLVSILYKAMPHEVKLLLIDPKMVELAPYNNIPHLVSPVITDAKAATAALKWAVEEMERRYELFAHAGARDLVRYNDLAKRHNQETLPYLVIVIDELADLMMVAPGDVEESICRIAQKARACGIHLIVATQRPSVDVITGLIKANIPTRVAFTVSSQVDSRTIIDVGGAEKLLGRGDMLFLNNGESKPIRLQGVYVSDDEIERVVDHVKEQMAPNYLFQKEELLAKVTHAESEDELFLEACEYVVEQGGASASMLQRRFRIGYNRAARLIDLMESRGIISEAKGSKPREVLISEDDLVGMAEG